MINGGRSDPVGGSERKVELMGLKLKLKRSGVGFEEAHERRPVLPNQD